MTAFCLVVNKVKLTEGIGMLLNTGYIFKLLNLCWFSLFFSLLLYRYDSSF